ncbi:hypothetical protein [Streptacidiphilus sp. P02-A3a]|uniref:hypothetical protein n=1 Tax=Streptacidiphilus sp. P02-A3a TaxID=2704468 RepID=UPI0015FB3A62|nr:hypothetical protein [Streptacidiphilus sp. P02-A3a]QMU72585.1 hypothetical protein GXP74_34420 [Streptacidiphilus sp. P02-A3a]
MSWDVLLLRLPDSIASVQEVPKDYVSPPLGRRREVLTALSQALPEADLSDDTWGQLSGPDWSIELNIGSRDPVDTIMLHLRGSDDEALTPVFRIAAALGCKALDCSEGDLISPENSPGWDTFQAFRDHVVGPAE